MHLLSVIELKWFLGHCTDLYNKQVSKKQNKKTSKNKRYFYFYRNYETVKRHFWIFRGITFFDILYHSFSPLYPNCKTACYNEQDLNTTTPARWALRSLKDFSLSLNYVCDKPDSQSCAVAKVEQFRRAHSHLADRMKDCSVRCSCLSSKTKPWKLLLRPAVCIPSLIVQWPAGIFHF